MVRVTSARFGLLMVTTPARPELTSWIFCATGPRRAVDIRRHSVTRFLLPRNPVHLFLHSEKRRTVRACRGVLRRDLPRERLYVPMRSVNRQISRLVTISRQVFTDVAGH